MEGPNKQKEKVRGTGKAFLAVSVQRAWFAALRFSPVSGPSLDDSLLVLEYDKSLGWSCLC